MRATLEEIQSEIKVLVADWPSFLEEGTLARDNRLVVDASNCSAIAYLYTLQTKGNALEITTRHNDLHVFPSLKDAGKAAKAFVDFVNRVEGYVIEDY